VTGAKNVKSRIISEAAEEEDYGIPNTTGTYSQGRGCWALI
jgi:hypothetical protein